MDKSKLVAALEAELDAYKRRNLADRVRQVEEQLRRLNGSAPRTAADSAPVQPASTGNDDPETEPLEPSPAKKAAARKKSR